MGQSTAAETEESGREEVDTCRIVYVLSKKKNVAIKERAVINLSEKNGKNLLNQEVDPEALGLVCEQIPSHQYIDAIRATLAETCPGTLIVYKRKRFSIVIFL